MNMKFAIMKLFLCNRAENSTRTWTFKEIFSWMQQNRLQNKWCYIKFLFRDQCFDLWIFCWLEMEGFCYGISREENKDIPFYGTVATFMQTHFVNRSSKESREEAMDTIVSRAKEMAWGRLIIFPEGHCSNGSGLLPFKKGAFLPGISKIHPVNWVINLPKSFWNE